MTRNEAYKAARRAWRFWCKRGAVTMPASWQNVVWELSIQGHTEKDFQMVRAWLKAFHSGRRYPEISTLERIENS